MEGLQAFGGLVVLVGGAELLVRGASQAALRLGVSSLIVSLAFVGIGTSAPEVAVTVLAAGTGRTDLALGNVLGSNVANVGLVIGICALLRVLTAERQLLRFDVPVLIAVTVIVGALASLGGGLSAVDGTLLLLIFLVYFGLTVRRGLGESKRARRDGSGAGALRPREWLAYGGMFVGGLAALIYGSGLLVTAASEIALRHGMSEALVGSTIVAIGTSLPEVATSAVATLRGELGVAVGNAVGSCVANLGLVLGTGCLVSGWIPVPEQLVRTDVLAAAAISVVLLIFLATEKRVNRAEAVMLLGGYAAYFYTVTKATRLGALETWPIVLGLYAVVLTAVVLLDLRTTLLPGRRQSRD